MALALKALPVFDAPLDVHEAPTLDEFVAALRQRVAQAEALTLDFASSNLGDMQGLTDQVAMALTRLDRNGLILFRNELFFGLGDTMQLTTEYAATADGWIAELKIDLSRLVGGPQAVVTASRLILRLQNAYLRIAADRQALAEEIGRNIALVDTKLLELSQAPRSTEEIARDLLSRYPTVTAYLAK